MRLSQPKFRLPQAIVLVVLVVILGYVVRSSRAATSSGDINGDGTVNILDLSIMLSHWGTNYAAADLNGDGTVSVFDLSILLAHWGQTVATPTPTLTPSTAKPTIVGHQLNLGTSGTRLKLHGVAVWGIQDQITGSFGSSEYANRQTIINTIKAWGGNEIRLRVLAADYNSQAYLSQAQQIQEVKDWQSAAQAAGLYTHITWWDSLDGAYNNANWASQYTQAFPMMDAVLSALSPTNPWVYYEPFNEPNNVSESSWVAAMKGTVAHFRSAGYTGILLLDTIGWSHAYSDADFTTLEAYDAAQTGMGSQHQLIFSKHDYANEYPNSGSGFDSSYWPQNNFGTSSWNFTNHLVWETEFGNYNGSPSSVSYPWSQGAASWMAQKLNDGTLAGASAFVYGPWYDTNAMTGTDNVTATQWGGYVKNNFLGAAQ